MSEHDVVRAWKDRRFRSRLQADEHDGVPAHPAGLVEVPDDRLERVGGGTLSSVQTIYTCWITYPHPIGPCTGPFGCDGYEPGELL